MMSINDFYMVIKGIMFVLAVLFCLFHFLNFNEHMFDKIKAWHQKRYWEKRHLEFLKTMLTEDARWFSIDPKLREITDRHEKAVSDTWYKEQYESVSDLRHRLLNKPSN